MAGARGRDDCIGLGGMFTILKVRDYLNAAGTRSIAETNSELRRDESTHLSIPRRSPATCAASVSDSRIKARHVARR
jgi:hypothetical protein